MLELKTQEGALSMHGKQTQSVEQTHLDALESQCEPHLLCGQDGLVKWYHVFNINGRFLFGLRIQSVILDQEFDPLQ